MEIAILKSLNYREIKLWWKKIFRPQERLPGDMAGAYVNENNYKLFRQVSSVRAKESVKQVGEDGRVSTMGQQAEMSFEQFLEVVKALNLNADGSEEEREKARKMLTTDLINHHLKQAEEVETCQFLAIRIFAKKFKDLMTTTELDEACQAGEKTLAPSKHLTFLPRLVPKKTLLRNNTVEEAKIYIS